MSTSTRTLPTAPALLATTLAAALVAGACSSSPTPQEGTSSTSPTASSTEAATSDAAEAEVVEIPDTPVGEQVTWTLAALVPDATVDPADAESRLSQAALAQLDGAGLAQAFASIAPTGPWEPIGYEGDASNALVQLRDAGGERLDLSVALDAEGLIETLAFQAGFEHVPATSWEELTDAVEALPAETTLVVTEVTDGVAGEEVFAAGEPDAAPIGSIVKLYVLGAVVDAVAAGTLTWQDELTVTDDVKSLPSGTLQDAPSGTTVTVQEAALQMISISDNTATDMLIAAVGREAVEAQLAEMGHHDPARNTPLLRTRDLFVLGWGDGGAHREAWAQGDADARRDLIASVPAGLPAVAVADVGAPVWRDGLDWFATPEDLVAAHLALQAKADTPAGEPVTEILGANPGFSPDMAQGYDEIAFKGGSSMGVLALSWYLSGEDGDHVITLQARGDEPALTTDGRPYLAVTEDALTLLAGD